MRYLPVGQDEEMIPRQQFAPQPPPQMQIPELEWSQHPANQPVQQGGEGMDWRKMFNPAKGETAESPTMTEAGGGNGTESVGAMATEGAKGGGGALKAIGSAISGF